MRVKKSKRSKKKIKPGIVGILCISSLAVGVVARAINTTPPAQPTPTATPAPAQKLPTPVKTSTPTNLTTPVKPAPAATTAPKIPTVKTPTPASIPTTVQPSVPRSVIPLVAVPTLTSTTSKNFANIYGQIIDVKFTPKQQQRIAQRIGRDWMLNLGLRNIVSQTNALESQIAKATPAQKAQIQSKLVATIRQQALDGDTDALWLVGFYDAVPKNWLAKGDPPLTRTSADVSADALSFMVNEVMGKSAISADSKLKNAIAAKLTAEYPKLSPGVKETLYRLPARWLRFKDSEWYSRTDEFREQMRIHWGKNLEAYIPELKPITKLRADRMAKLKADPIVKWNTLNTLQRQAALQSSELNFQSSLRALPQTNAAIQLNSYINTMQLGNAIGNSPTRYSLKLNVK